MSPKSRQPQLFIHTNASIFLDYNAFDTMRGMPLNRIYFTLMYHNAVNMSYTLHEMLLMIRFYYRYL